MPVGPHASTHSPPPGTHDTTHSVDLLTIQDIVSLRTSWIGLSTNVDSSMLKHLTRAALELLVPAAHNETTLAYVIYVDGAGEKPSLPGSWALAIFRITAAGWHTMGWIAGRTVTEPWGNQYIGATSSGSGAGEFSAQVWAALAVLALGLDKTGLLFY